MPFSVDTTLCDENHHRAQTMQAEEEKRIAERNKKFYFPELDSGRNDNFDDSTNENKTIDSPRCYISQGKGGTYDKPNTYQQDFYGADTDERIAQLTTEQIKQAVYETFEESGAMTGDMTCGATFSVAITTADNKIITAHIGDTRIVLFSGGNATTLTWDHKAETERARITAAGGTVSKVNDIWRVGGMLAISRAFGNDRFIGKLFIPSLNVRPYTEADTLMIATDGLWDVVAPNEIAKAANQELKNVADLVRATAFKRGSRDNCTVLLAKLVANSIYFVGDGHGFDEQKNPAYDAVNVIKDNFLLILKRKIGAILNPAAYAQTSREAAPSQATQRTQSSASLTQEYHDEPVIDQAAQSTSPTTTTATTSVSTRDANRLKRAAVDDDDSTTVEDNSDDDDNTRSAKFARR
jgi:serine/threonine protein phosphatase PrpC